MPLRPLTVLSTQSALPVQSWGTPHGAQRPVCSLCVVLVVYLRNRCPAQGQDIIFSYVLFSKLHSFTVSITIHDLLWLVPYSELIFVQGVSCGLRLVPLPWDVPLRQPRVL